MHDVFYDRTFVTKKKQGINISKGTESFAVKSYFLHFIQISFHIEI